MPIRFQTILISAYILLATMFIGGAVYLAGSHHTHEDIVGHPGMVRLFEEHTHLEGHEIMIENMRQAKQAIRELQEAVQELTDERTNEETG